MRIYKLPINQINYEKKEYPEYLKQSIKERGLNFPIKVKQIENGYLCLDGNKRLSAIHDLYAEKQIEFVEAIIDVRSHDHWRNKNYH